jgi:hypothetical protein
MLILFDLVILTLPVKVADINLHLRLLHPVLYCSDYGGCILKYLIIHPSRLES